MTDLPNFNASQSFQHKKEERECSTPYCCVQTPFEEYRGQTDHIQTTSISITVMVTASRCVTHSITLAMLSYMRRQQWLPSQSLWIDKCILCVVLHKLTSVLFKERVHTAVQSRLQNLFSTCQKFVRSISQIDHMNQVW